MTSASQLLYELQCVTVPFDALTQAIVRRAWLSWRASQRVRSPPQALVRVSLQLLRLRFRLPYLVRGASLEMQSHDVCALELRASVVAARVLKRLRCRLPRLGRRQHPPLDWPRATCLSMQRAPFWLMPPHSRLLASPTPSETLYRMRRRVRQSPCRRLSLHQPMLFRRPPTACETG